MDNSDFHFQSHQARPFFHLGGTPVYLTTLLVAVHVMALLVGVSLPQYLLEVLAFESRFVGHGEVWRVVTYIFIHSVGIGTVINLIFLFMCGRQLEERFGRRDFGILYLLGVLVPALVLWCGYAVTSASYVLVGTQWVHFSLMLSVAFLYPNAHMFVCWLKLKWVALVFFAIEVLSLLQVRAFVMLLAYLATCAVTYLWLRRCGLGTRFDGVIERLQSMRPRALEPKPKLRLLDGGKARDAKPSAYYEPKIRPRAELDREHPAVVEIDALLDKISREGFGSLTAEEKQALDRASAELKDKDRRL